MRLLDADAAALGLVRGDRRKRQQTIAALGGLRVVAARPRQAQKPLERPRIAGQKRRGVQQKFDRPKQRRQRRAIGVSDGRVSRRLALAQALVAVRLEEVGGHGDEVTGDGALGVAGGRTRDGAQRRQIHRFVDARRGQHVGGHQRALAGLVRLDVGGVGGDQQVFEPAVRLGRIDRGAEQHAQERVRRTQLRGAQKNQLELRQRFGAAPEEHRQLGERDAQSDGVGRRDAQPPQLSVDDRQRFIGATGLRQTAQHAPQPSQHLALRRNRRGQLQIALRRGLVIAEQLRHLRRAAKKHQPQTAPRLNALLFEGFELRFHCRPALGQLSHFEDALTQRFEERRRHVQAGPRPLQRAPEGERRVEIRRQLRLDRRGRLALAENRQKAFDGGDVSRELERKLDQPLRALLTPRTAAALDVATQRQEQRRLFTALFQTQQHAIAHRFVVAVQADQGVVDARQKARLHQLAGLTQQGDALLAALVIGPRREGGAQPVPVLLRAKQLGQLRPGAVAGSGLDGARQGLFLGLSVFVQRRGLGDAQIGRRAIGGRHLTGVQRLAIIKRRRVEVAQLVGQIGE